jgi:hypothetical protein
VEPLAEVVAMRSSPTVEYLRRRQLVLGSRWSCHDDPAVAAVWLAERLGGIDRAIAWADRLVDALHTLKGTRQ